MTANRMTTTGEHRTMAVVAICLLLAAMAFGPSAEAASPHNSTRTNDQCTRVAFHNHTFVSPTNGRAWTAVQIQFGSIPDPECTGYVEVRTSSAAGTYTTTSSNDFVQRNYGNAGFNYTDHNAQSAVTGVLWGHRLF